ncbi:MAG TPA: hypothetical protein PKN04_04850 [bacterium]|nr:hypothetical protein [bacterium]HNT65089.1 hypothetical protein [bacterium]HOX84496.1 hypothetical protein [bacterium]HPG45907.1 hypothetical protein [bacterium]HPM97729.1 hypothetical protein [bacterium]
MRPNYLVILVGLLWFMVCPVWAQLGDDTPAHDARIEKILQAKEIGFTIDKDGDFKVVVDVGNGRTQLAFIFSSTMEYGNMEIREIWAYAYRSENNQFPVDVANLLLEDTFPKKLGAWAKKDNMALYMVRISANANEQSLLSAVQFAAEAADEMEEKLTGAKDEF